MEFTCPFEPRYANPCDREGKYKDDENVDEAVENSPPVNPSVVEVLAPYDVNGRI